MITKGNVSTFSFYVRAFDTKNNYRNYGEPATQLSLEQAKEEFVWTFSAANGSQLSHQWLWHGRCKAMCGFRLGSRSVYRILFTCRCTHRSCCSGKNHE